MTNNEELPSLAAILATLAIGRPLDDKELLLRAAAQAAARPDRPVILNLDDHAERPLWG